MKYVIIQNVCVSENMDEVTEYDEELLLKVLEQNRVLFNSDGISEIFGVNSRITKKFEIIEGKLDNYLENQRHLSTNKMREEKLKKKEQELNENK